jgi:hypothetical protein
MPTISGAIRLEAHVRETLYVAEEAQAIIDGFAVGPYGWAYFAPEE